ncbi:MAG TPA: recombinase XerC, partial [Clostridiales bacterium]|nr:recombinase XerC [Clostridiales bacterium]
HLNTTEIYTHIDNTELRIAASANPLGSFKAEKKRKTGDS